MPVEFLDIRRYARNVVKCWKTNITLIQTGESYAQNIRNRRFGLCSYRDDPAAVVVWRGCACASEKNITQQDLDKAKPAATVDIDIKQLRLIFGGEEGSGVLHFKGKDYPFTVKGVSLGGVGFSEVEGHGVVHYLNKVEDFPGTYTAIGIGAALVHGAGKSSYQNGKGVVFSLKSKQSGLALNLGIQAGEFAFKK